MTDPATLRAVPEAWRALYAELNGGRVPDGTPGIRDQDAPCEHYDLDGSLGAVFSDCETDGHYLCEECVHISARALRRRRDQCEDCGTALVPDNYGGHVTHDPIRCPECDPFPVAATAEATS